MKTIVRTSLINYRLAIFLFRFTFEQTSCGELVLPE